MKVALNTITLTPIHFSHMIYLFLSHMIYLFQVDLTIRWLITNPNIVISHMIYLFQGGFLRVLRFPPPINLTAMIFNWNTPRYSWNIAKVDVKHQSINHFNCNIVESGIKHHNPKPYLFQSHDISISKSHDISISGWPHYLVLVMTRICQI